MVLRNESRQLKQRRNPVALALEWQALLDSGEVPSRAALARQLGVSRAHVTQVLRVLRLPQEERQAMLALGDPIVGNEVGIHTLLRGVRIPTVDLRGQNQELFQDSS
jgi:hypothetical protein